jgi:prephenate dehydrogenase
MFGPHAVTDMSGQVVAICRERSGRWAEFLLELLKGQGAILKETTPAEHDKMMSIIQGLTHLSSIATAMALQKLGFHVEESFEFSSPIYRLRLEMVGRILSQDPQLYADIALENPLTKDSLAAYQEAIEQLAGMVEDHDTAGFVREFQQVAQYLGDFKDDAYRRTTQLIEQSKNII